MHRLILALALASCSTAPPGRDAVPAAASLADTAEGRYWSTQAALLDPRCWHLLARQGDDPDFDVTVPDGHTWYASNALGITYGEPTGVAQDEWFGSRTSGAIRTLDSRRALALPAGTRIRNNHTDAAPGTPGYYRVSQSYLWYCDPADAPAVDDPRWLYFDRLARLETLPIRSARLEVIGGGSVGAGLRYTLTGTADIMIVGVEVYDVSWLTVGWLGAVPCNTLDEISNAHRHRAGAVVLQAFPRGPGIEIAVQKGNAGDVPGSDTDGIDPDWIRPLHGSALLLYVELPEGW